MTDKPQIPTTVDNPTSEEEIIIPPLVDERFTVEVATRKIEEAKLLPEGVLRFLVKHILVEVYEGITENAVRAVFEVKFPPIEENTTVEDLIKILEKLGTYFNISNLLQKDYPFLYQVKSKDPNGPIVSFYSFSDEVVNKHLVTAWTAAKTSRDPSPYSKMFGDLIEIMKGRKDHAVKKIEDFGIGYGHSSILELVPVFIFINNVPITSAYLIHHLIETYSSQELSTRYVEFLNLYIKPIEEWLNLSTIPNESKEDAEYIKKEWREIQELALAQAQKWKGLVTDAYQKQFGDYNTKGEKIKKDTKKARALDIWRNRLIMGFPTSVAVLSNVRTFISLIRQLRETEVPELVELADQIEFAMRVDETTEGKSANSMLGPLIKHAEPKYTIKNNVGNLKSYLEYIPDFLEMLEDSQFIPENYNRKIQVSVLDNTDEIILTVIQYIKVAYPSLDEINILKWLATLTPDEQANIGQLIFRDHFRHNPMGNMGNIKSSVLGIIKAALSEMRDWNRQRASGKADAGFLLPMIYNQGPIDFDAIINQGFITCVQLYKTTGLKHLEKEWDEDTNIYYKRLHAFYHYIRDRFPDVNLFEFQKLLPLGHMTTFHLSTPVSQKVYTHSLRETRGNDFANIEITHELAKKTRTSPFLRDINLGFEENVLDFNSVDQYADRT